MKRIQRYTANKTSLYKSAQRLLIPLMFTLLLFSTAQAQNADEYFHNSAKSFIGAELQDAIAYVEEGLAKYPEDAKLNALLEKLKEQQEQQQQQQEQNQQQQDQQEQQEQEQNQQDQEQDQNHEKQEEQQEQGEDGESEDDPLQQMEETLESQSISKEDAEKILQALAQKEKELLKEFKKQKKEGSAKHEKDW